MTTTQSQMLIITPEMKPEEKYQQLFEQMYSLCEAN